MRKIHSTALAGLLKIRLRALSLDFRPLKAEEASVFQTQKRMSYVAELEHGRGYLLFEPSATARDNYFTLDIAWIRRHLNAAVNLEPLYSVHNSELSDIARWHAVRMRASCLWDSDGEGEDAFKFSTASARYSEWLFAMAREASQPPEAESFIKMKDMWAEEGSLTPEGAAVEVEPALERCLELVDRHVLPFFRSADESSSAAV